MKKLLIVSLIAVTVYGLIYSVKQKSTLNSVAVDTHVVEKDTLNSTILASGNLKFSKEIQIRSEVIGIVTQLHVNEGDVVSKNQLLMELDPASFIAEVEKASASVAIQEIEIKRLLELLKEARRRAAQHKILLEKGLSNQDTYASSISRSKISALDVDVAHQRLAQYQASLAQSEDKLNKTRFLAPTDGLISSVDIREGETVIAGTLNIAGSILMTLADVDSYVAQLRVDEADIANVSIGQAVEVFAAARPRAAIQGRVASISTTAKNAQQGKGLFHKVKVIIDDKQTIYPGMSCRAEILVDQSPSSFMVPIAAVKHDSEGQFVWLAKHNRATKRSVTLGLASDIEQIVESGITEGDIVIVGPSRLLSTMTAGVNIEVKES